MPSTSKKIYEALNVENHDFSILKDYGFQKKYNIKDIDILFKRLDIKDVLKLVEKPKEEIKEPSKEEISIDDFDKIEFVVGKILEAKNHPKADKLLVFKVDIGTEVRQIVSGIAKFYNPNDLIGKKVVVVKNLKAIKLRGEESKGMLLCASDKSDKHLEVLNIDKLNPGDIIR